MVLCLDGCGEEVKPGCKFVSGTHSLGYYIQNHPDHQSKAGVKGGLIAGKMLAAWTVANPQHQIDAGLKGGKLGGKRTQELHPNQSSEVMTRTNQRYPNMAHDAGLKGGLIGGARTAELHPHEYFVQIGHKGGTQAHRLYPDMVSDNGRKAMQTRALENPNVFSEMGIIGSERSLYSRDNPSGPENRVFSLIHVNKIPFDYTGNGTMWIGHKPHRNPDFNSWYVKTVIEVAVKTEKEFRKKKSWQQWERETVDFYTFYGYKCIVLWDDMSDEEMLKLMEFS